MSVKSYYVQMLAVGKCAIKSKETETMNFCARMCQCPVQHVDKHSENQDFHSHPADL